MQAPNVPADEATRLAVLQALQVLDTPQEERFERHTRLARRLFGVPIAIVSLIDTDRQWFKSIQGLDVTEAGRDVSFCGHVVYHPDLMVIEDATNDERFADNPLVASDPNIRFYAGAPLEVDGQVLGTLCVIDRQPRQLDSEEQASLEDLAEMVCAELQSLNQATSDTLTGLCNRRGLYNVMRHLIPTEAAAEKETAAALSAVLIDMDRFKEINDTWGHQAGDEALLATSRILSRVFNGGDWVARLGGDEFCVLSSGRTPDEQAERLRLLAAEVERFNLENDAPWQVMYSAGVSHSPRADAVTLEVLLEDADKRMYANKQARRCAAAR